MDSSEIKEMLDEFISDELEDFYPYTEEDTEKSLGKWKRLKKTKNQNGQWERVFENTYLKIKFLVVEDEIAGVLADGKYVFCMSDTSSNFFASDYEYFKKEGYQSDWHLGGWVVMPKFVSEFQEGHFRSNKNSQETRDALLALGFVEDEEYSKFSKQYII